MKKNKVKFGTGGFRALIGEDFTKENVSKIAQAICNIIKKEKLKKHIAVGYDNRFLSEFAATWASEVFAANDVVVTYFEKSVPTPVVMYYAKQHKLDYSICITASHNPYNFNGVKVFYKSADASFLITKQIEEEIEKIKLEDIKTINFNDAIYNDKVILLNETKNYLNSIYNLIDVQKIYNSNLKVCFDSMYGSSSDALNLLIEDLGLVEAKKLHFNRDAFFGFQLPAPNENTITELVKTVTTEKYDIGFALDGDGDRLAIVDKNGNFVDNNYILGCLYYYYLKYKNKKGDAVKNICTLNLLDIIAQKFGFNCHEVNVGFKNVSYKMLETNALIGGESSGGLAMLNHILGKDSIFSICLVIEMLCDINKPINEILLEVKKFANNYDHVMFEKSFTYNESDKPKILNVLLEEKQLPKFNKQIKEVKYDDYVKVCFTDNTWTTIRFSGTEPIIRIISEANPTEKSDDIYDPWLNLIFK